MYGTTSVLIEFEAKGLCGYASDAAMPEVKLDANVARSGASHFNTQYGYLVQNKNAISKH